MWEDTRTTSTSPSTRYVRIRRKPATTGDNLKEKSYHDMTWNVFRTFFDYIEDSLEGRYSFVDGVSFDFDAQLFGFGFESSTKYYDGRVKGDLYEKYADWRQHGDLTLFRVSQSKSSMTPPCLFSQGNLQESACLLQEKSSASFGCRLCAVSSGNRFCPVLRRLSRSKHALQRVRQGLRYSLRRYGHHG